MTNNITTTSKIQIFQPAVATPPRISGDKLQALVKKKKNEAYKNDSEKIYQKITPFCLPLLVHDVLKPIHGVPFRPW